MDFRTFAMAAKCEYLCPMSVTTFTNFKWSTFIAFDGCKICLAIKLLSCQWVTALLVMVCTIKGAPHTYMYNHVYDVSHVISLQLIVLASTPMDHPWRSFRVIFLATTSRPTGTYDQKAMSPTQCQVSPAMHDYIITVCSSHSTPTHMPYSRKLWWKFKFGSLVISLLNCQKLKPAEISSTYTCMYVWWPCTELPNLKLHDIVYVRMYLCTYVCVCV